MKLFFICLLLSGCGAFQKCSTDLTGEFAYKCSRNGVEYVLYDNSLAPSYDQKGDLVHCN